jgi:hypothetical protein
MQNLSPIKQRIIQFVDTHYSSRREFYKRTEISRGTLENESGITEETLSKIFTKEPGLSPSWVIAGEGPMLKSTKGRPSNKEKASFRRDEAMAETHLSLLIKEKNDIIKELRNRVHEQTKFIDHLMSRSKSPDMNGDN